MCCLLLSTKSCNLSTDTAPSEGPRGLWQSRLLPAGLAQPFPQHPLSTVRSPGPAAGTGRPVGCCGAPLGALQGKAGFRPRAEMIHRKHRCWIVPEVLRAAAEGKKNPETLSVEQGGRFLRIFVAVLWLQSNLKHN